MKVLKNSLVVYTVILGPEFELNPVEHYEGVMYICFTDVIPQNNSGWEIRIIPPILPGDLPRSSRDFKIRPHLWLSEFENSLYVDSKVLLKGNPQEFWNILTLGDHSISLGLINHSFRETIFDEFKAVLENKFDSQVVLEEQLLHYQNHYPELLSE